MTCSRRTIAACSADRGVRVVVRRRRRPRRRRAGRERATVADGLARLAEHSLLVVERGEPDPLPGVGDDPPVRRSSSWTQAGELDEIRAGHERWCRRCGRGASATAAPTGGRCLVRHGSTRSPTISAPRSSGAHATRAAGRRRRNWPPSWPGCCSCEAGRRRRSDVTSRPPNSRKRGPSGCAACGWPPARPPAGSRATTRCGCSGMAADAARSRRPGWRGPGSGDDGDVHQPRARGSWPRSTRRRKLTRWSPKARALSDGSPVPRQRSPWRRT